ncbi:MAG TPA: fatty acid desaturase [Nocardioidaceae bacterium]
MIADASDGIAVDSPAPSETHGGGNEATLVAEGICWTTVAGLAFIHVGAGAGLAYLLTRPAAATLLLAVVLYVLCGLSITAGYHRLFAHRTYRASAPVRWFYLAFGAATFQNSALAWSADHRAHHADTDGAGDPHAVGRGPWWVHVGWLFHRRQASADVSKLGDLYAVRSIRLQHRFYPVLAIGLGLVLPMTIAWLFWGDPWGGLLVAGLLRAALMLQATFCVNSLAHMIGKPRYDRRVSARDSVVTALVTFGEGYHSFHHRFPYDYRNGIHWWQYDPSKWLIWSLARLRLASRTRTASRASVGRARGRALDPLVAVKAPTG